MQDRNTFLYTIMLRCEMKKSGRDARYGHFLLRNRKFIVIFKDFSEKVVV